MTRTTDLSPDETRDSNLLPAGSLMDLPACADRPTRQAQIDERVARYAARVASRRACVEMEESEGDSR